ncbi:poly [ADP-ribose] polymerase 1 [Folsomia candida]|uniref:poly [ADP-ribose] polymerase 1 n=1 Tax=Folsomia candida TaxID=158441 RepID=UPI000B8F89E5|nr:poly [ADP-ribose] polymerase 1 [Folsomia candida]
MGHMFRVVRRDERERFLPFQNFNNRRLLWHGSRTSNIAGILMHGLKASPSGAENSTWNRGIYFADVSTKSAWYCRVASSSEVGILLLSYAIHGRNEITRNTTFPEKLPEEYNSIKVIGKYQSPDVTGLMIDGVQIPLGTPQKMKQDADMEHNE